MAIVVSKQQQMSVRDTKHLLQGKLSCFIELFGQFSCV